MSERLRTNCLAEYHFASPVWDILEVICERGSAAACGMTSKFTTGTRRRRRRQRLLFSCIFFLSAAAAAALRDAAGREKKTERWLVVCVAVSRQMCSAQSRRDRDEPFCPGTGEKKKSQGRMITRCGRLPSQAILLLLLLFVPANPSWINNDINIFCCVFLFSFLFLVFGLICCLYDVGCVFRVFRPCLSSVSAPLCIVRPVRLLAPFFFVNQFRICRRLTNQLTK
jgi:hypothetical protein